jgi:hypothetical protein
MNTAAGDLRLSGQSMLFFKITFLLSVADQHDGIVKKKGPYNPAQG